MARSEQYTARKSEIEYNAFSGREFDEWSIYRDGPTVPSTHQLYTARRYRDNNNWWIRNVHSGHVINVNTRIWKRVLEAVEKLEAE